MSTCITVLVIERCELMNNYLHQGILRSVVFVCSILPRHDTKELQPNVLLRHSVAVHVEIEL